jgi:hypothetical protein
VPQEQNYKGSIHNYGSKQKRFNKSHADQQGWFKYTIGATIECTDAKRQFALAIPPTQSNTSTATSLEPRTEVVDLKTNGSSVKQATQIKNPPSIR